MPHPFFDALTYPWARPEALRFYEMLYTVYSVPARIDVLYRQCQAGLPPLALGAAPDVIWKEALENLASRGALRRLCEIVQGEPHLQNNPLIQSTIQDVLNAQPSSDKPVISDGPWSAGRRKRLQTEYDELQRQFDTLTSRIAALDKDLGRELDSERLLALEDRKAEQAGKRDLVSARMAQIEQKLVEQAATEQAAPASDQKAAAPATDVAKDGILPKPVIQMGPETTKTAKPIELVSPDRLIITDPIRLELVRVEAGEFLMGTRSIDIEDLLGLYKGERKEYEWETEQYLLALPEFYIATTMVTVEQFDAFVKAKGYPTEAEQRNWGLVRKDDQWEKTSGASWRHPRGPVTHTSHKSRHPVTQVSFHDVVEFCRWLQRAVDSGLQSHLDTRRWELRIPTEAEWEKAARGPKGPVFPWGSQAPDDNRCNYEMLVKDTTEVDQYPSGRSPYGVFDMAGNVWEWTATLWNSQVEHPPYPYPYNPDDKREDPNRVGPRVMRGGSYHDNAWIIRSAFRHRRIQSDSIDCGSFRVCAVLQQE